MLLISPRTVPKTRRLLIAWVLLLAPLVALPADGEPWVARHGLTNSQYQSTFEDLAKKGYRLTAVSGYDVGGRARYAALWTKTGGPAWRARHGLTANQYQSTFDDLTKKGYRLTFVNGYSVGQSVRYAAIWTKTGGPAWRARHGLTASQYQSAVTNLSKKGYSLTHLSAYDLGGSPRFAAIFEKGGPRWVARHGLTASGYQKAFDRFARKGYRLKVVSGYRQGNGDRYAALWIKTGGPQWSARHGIPDTHYQHVFDNYSHQGWQPQYLEAFNSSSGVRFNGLWKNAVFSGRELSRIRSKVRQYMQSRNTPGLSLAIGLDDRLVYAAGFGVADKESGVPVGPKHRFRVASVSKPITVVAVKRLIQESDLTLGSKVFGPGSVLGGQFTTPKNNQKIEDITVDHLLKHEAGFVNKNKDGQSSDPMFAYSGGGGHAGLIQWTLENYPLGFDPGTDDSYSNFGYCVLGRVIEAKTGKSYEAYVRDEILKPAGAPGMVIGGNKEADRKRYEVKYYGGGAYSSVKPERFDSHGGWIATPIDLLRFLRYENELGTPYAFYGAMSGTHAVIRRRSDGFTFAAATNSSSGKVEDLNALLVEILKEVDEWPTYDLF